VTEARPHGATASPVEAAAFGFTVGRLEYGPDTDWATVDIDADLASSDFDLVVLRYPTERLEVVERVHASGRRSLTADTLLHFRWEPLALADTGGLSLRPLDESDVPLLDLLVSESFAGYRNHYLSNPMTRHVNPVAAYQEWARTFIDHPTRRAFVVQAPGDDEAGMCAFEWDGTHLESILAGVRPRARGHSIYPDVLRLQGNWACEHGLTSMGILTQVWNTAAMRAMIRTGFLPERALSTLHVMRP
jgi:RimJ/RimL family protein N-acetyltransferase